MASNIDVRGIRKVNRAFRQIDRNLPKETAAELQGVARVVAHQVQAKVPRRTGRARGSVRTRKRQNTAVLVAGGNRVPYYQWLDFGGRVGVNKSVRRPFLKKGRYIYPTIAEHGDEIKKNVEQTLVNVARKAGFEVR